jgi:predicted DNA-binding transcriptional regulator AlpA
MPHKSEGPHGRLLTPTEAAEELQISGSWLAKSRLRGDGPRYRKLGRSVRYASEDLEEFIESRRRRSTSE